MRKEESEKRGKKLETFSFTFFLFTFFFPALFFFFYNLLLFSFSTKGLDAVVLAAVVLCQKAINIRRGVAPRVGDEQGDEVRRDDVELRGQDVREAAGGRRGRRCR